MIEMASASHPGSFWARPRAQLLLVFLVAAAVRSVFVLRYGPIVTNDSTLYLTTAREFLAGMGIGLPSRVMPGYPLFVAGVYSIWNSPWAILWAQTVAGALTCVVLAATCRRIFRADLAFLLGLIVALYLPLAAFSAAVLRETLIALGVSLTTYSLARLLQEQRLAWSWATGVAGILTLFCQPTFLFFPFWTFLALWIHSRKLGTTFRLALPVVACIVIAIALWTVRNYRLTSRFIPMTADHVGCYVLEGIMDANQLEPKRLTTRQIDYLDLRGDDPYNDYAGLRDRYIRGSIETKLRDGPVLFRRAVSLVLHEPASYLHFSLKRLHWLWLKDLWVERTDDSYLNVRPLDRVRREWGIGGKALTLVIYLFGYSSIVGMVLFWRQGLGLIVPIVTMLSFHMWVHAETRYALAVHPHLLIFSVLTVCFLARACLVRGERRQDRLAWFLRAPSQKTDG